MESSIQDRPRWWMSRRRRWALAAVRAARLPVGLRLQEYTKDRDQLALGLAPTGALGLVLSRSGRALFGAGDHGVFRWFGGELEAVELPYQGQSHVVVRAAGRERTLAIGARMEVESLALRLITCDADSLYPKALLSIARTDAGAEDVAEDCARALAEGMTTTDWRPRPW
jgi:hypothetical protein